jgi:hypothetical protein
MTIYLNSFGRQGYSGLIVRILIYMQVDLNEEEPNNRMLGPFTFVTFFRASKEGDKSLVIGK